MITEEKAVELVESKSKEVDVFMNERLIAKVEDQATYDKAAEVAKEIRAAGKKLEAQRVELVKPLNDTVKKINDLFKKPIERLEMFELGIKRLCTNYQIVQDNIRLEKQHKADEEARKERERIEAEARAQRAKEEAARKAQEEAERKARESTNAAEKKKLEAEAEKRRKEAESAAAKAETKESIASTVVAPVVESVVTNKGGVYTVDKFTVEIADKKAFIEWVLKSEMLEYLDVNESMLNKEAQNTKGLRQWPGIKINVTKEPRMKG